jgi:hypothetical protein
LLDADSEGGGWKQRDYLAFTKRLNDPSEELTAAMKSAPQMLKRDGFSTTWRHE